MILESPVHLMIKSLSIKRHRRYIRVSGRRRPIHGACGQTIPGLHAPKHVYTCGARYTTSAFVAISARHGRRRLTHDTLFVSQARRANACAAA